MTYSRIAGTGSYLPEKVVTNQDLETMMDTSDEWIQDRTGIKRRHIAAEGETTSDLALAAAGRAMEMAGITAVGLSKAKQRGDIRASTLQALASQLDLELALVPRRSKQQAVAAIKSGSFFRSSADKGDKVS